MRLAERTALVTGASRGSVAPSPWPWPRRAADVSVNYVSNETPAQQLAEEIKQMGRQAILGKG